MRFAVKTISDKTDWNNKINFQVGTSIAKATVLWAYPLMVFEADAGVTGYLYGDFTWPKAWEPVEERWIVEVTQWGYDKTTPISPKNGDIFYIYPLLNYVVLSDERLEDGVYPGMPAPEGWEWTKPITYIEIRTAERRAALDPYYGDYRDVLEHLLNMYGVRIPITGVAEILDIYQAPGFYKDAEGNSYTIIKVDIELFVVYNGWWHLSGIFNEGSIDFIWALPKALRPLDDYPPAPASIGVHSIEGHLGQRGLTPEGALRQVPVAPGDYTIFVTLSRSYGGQTIPALHDTDIASFHKVVSITEVPEPEPKEVEMIAKIIFLGIVPSVADKGQVVLPTVGIQNIGYGDYRMRAIGTFTGVKSNLRQPINFSPTEAHIMSGDSATFWGSFSMPEEDVKIQIRSQIWDEFDREWYNEDVKEDTVSLKGAVSYEFAITKPTVTRV